MKRNIVIAITAGLTIVVTALVVTSFRGPEHYPNDLSYWFRSAAARDWLPEAAQGKPQAQLCCGLNLIRSNLVVMTDNAVVLSSIPLVGKRFFQKTSYNIDQRISQEQLAEAYQWVSKAVDQGFSPARQAQKLFIGRVPMPNSPVQLGTNSTPMPAGSSR
jgi:hypothetical protein